MQEPIPWNDLALFAAVARTGTLAAAAAETGTSTATLSRRMTAFERQMGKRLFHHGQAGYAITDAGRDLLDRVKRMEAVAADLDRWRADSTAPVRVRISSGVWTALRLAQNLRAFWSPDDPWIPEFVQCHRMLDLARREIDIGIRNLRPDQPWLAGRRTGETTHSVYAVSPEVTDWIGGSFETAPLPSERWVEAHHGAQVVTTANDPALRLSLAEAGLGRVVLPDFIGLTRPKLVRLSDPIAALTREEWLVSHHETRHEPGIRHALDAVGSFLARTPAPPP
ncbi:LysR family transcriptional regulator [Jannaschia pagri]|uniref:LysR family transcriptional regulator n=1 Tax=Jannaschia pagri TaxID=2829797 RepID=A0ABQ4NPB8_9RHOB|nr:MULTISPECIES: LysR family transcriptional regulator [unclassified Jannaschia]GIT92427.1 LysR family transcriptional regulator [Jannaschia sp. AI_61]GIT96262.1 LysR family transcriptional regulator [Jannaschia sp. AI_62]